MNKILDKKEKMIFSLLIKKLEHRKSDFLGPNYFTLFTFFPAKFVIFYR